MKSNYMIDYLDENEYKKLERSIKKYNMLAYKELVFKCYSSLRNGKVIGKRLSASEDNKTVTYEYELPTTTMFAKIHGLLKLNYTINESENKIILNTLEPESILGEGHRSELSTYKGVMISKDNANKDKFKIELLNMIKD